MPFGAGQLPRGTCPHARRARAAKAAIATTRNAAGQKPRRAGRTVDAQSQRVTPARAAAGPAATAAP